MRNHFRFALTIALSALTLVGLGACGSASHSHRALHSRVYQDPSGHYYTHTHDTATNTMLWYVYAPITASDTPVARTSAVTLSGGSWSKTDPPSASLTATTKTVSDTAEGEPETTVEDAASVPADEVVNDTTSETAAESESAGSTDSNSTTDSGSTSDSGTSDSGSSDSGSADGGGGGE